MNKWPAIDDVGQQTMVEHAASLLNQQIWCWGCDIESAHGNRLVEYGFQRIAKPAGKKGASLYRLELSPNARVILRGFGIFFGDDRWGGVFLRRFDFEPQLTPQPDLSRPLWSLQDLPSLSSPSLDQSASCQWLLLTLVDWILRYEVWIAERLGVVYRNQTLRGWNPGQFSVVPAEQMTIAWRMLGLAISDQPENFIPALRTRGRRHG